MPAESEHGIARVSVKCHNLDEASTVQGRLCIGNPSATRPVPRNTWLASESYSLADMVAAPVIGRVTRLGFEDLWRELANLTEWIGRLTGQPIKPRYTGTSFVCRQPRRDEIDRSRNRRRDPSPRAAGGSTSLGDPFGQQASGEDDAGIRPGVGEKLAGAFVHP